MLTGILAGGIAVSLIGMLLLSVYRQQREVDHILKLLQAEYDSLNRYQMNKPEPAYGNDAIPSDNGNPDHLQAFPMSQDLSFLMLLPHERPPICIDPLPDSFFVEQKQ